jgi:hypothetical protein
VLARTLDDVADGVRIRVCGHDERARVRLQHSHAVVPDAVEQLRRLVERRQRADGPVLAPRRRAAEATPVEHVRPPAALMPLLLSLLVPRRCECSGEEEGAEEEEDEEERNPRSASGARHCVRQVEVCSRVVCGAWFCMQAEVALICSSVRPRLRGGRLRGMNNTSRHVSPLCHLGERGRTGPGCDVPDIIAEASARTHRGVQVHPFLLSSSSTVRFPLSSLSRGLLGGEGCRAALSSLYPRDSKRGGNNRTKASCNLTR